MTIDSKGLATARRNLAQRIERMLARIEGREPTAWESHYMSIALGQLELDHTTDGERTMLEAEREDVFNTAVSPHPLPADAKTATAAELRARLATMYDEGGHCRTC